MKKIILSAAGALALAACGSGNDQTLHNDVDAAIDEQALVSAVNQSIDLKAAEGLAHGAVAGAVREAIPPELRAVGAVIDEKALVRGVDQAVDGKALGNTIQGAIKGVEEPPK